VALEDNNAGSAYVSSNGVTMTLVATVAAGHNLSVYQMPACTGAQTILAFETFGFLSGTSVSLLNAVAQPNAESIAGAGGSVPAGSTYSTSVTSTVNRCLGLQFLDESFGPGSIFTAGAGTRMIVTGTNSSQNTPDIAATTVVQSPAGPVTVNVTSNATQSVWSITIAVAPSAGFAANQSVFSIQ
jgi:hypothetical protein